MNKNQESDNYQPRIDKIHNLILEIASGNFDARGSISESLDEIDAITAGINMLVEELKISTVSRDYFNSIYQSIVDMVIIVDNQGIITSTNDEVQSLLGYTPAELKGRHYSFILDKNSRNLYSVFKSLINQRSFQSAEKVFSTKDGEKLYVTCSGSLLYDKRNKSNGILCIARDISRLKKYEDALVRKNKEMDNFVYKASHDLKGPLVSIIGLAEVARMEAGSSPVSSYLNMIIQTASKLNNTLVTLLKLAISDNALKEKKTFMVYNTVNSILSLLSEKARINNVQILNNISPEIDLCSNEVLFGTIIQNLVENAIKYKANKRRPFIQLNAVKEDSTLKITIIDNGIGIPEGQLGNIFNMFFRANRTQEGSGLGLFIVQNHIEKLQGAISVKSVEGLGTTFFLMIPDLK